MNWNRIVSFAAALAALCLAGCEAGSPEIVDPRAGIKTVGGEDPSFGKNGFEAAPIEPASETPSTSPEPEDAPEPEPVVIDTDPSDDWELCLKYKMFEGKWWNVEHTDNWGFKYPSNKEWWPCTCTPVPERAACEISCYGEFPAETGLPLKSEVSHTETYDPVYDITTVKETWGEVTFEPCSKKVVPGHPDYYDTCIVEMSYLNGYLDSEWWLSRAAAN